VTIYLPLKRPLVYFFQCIFPISLLYFSLQPYLYFISIIMLLNDEVIVMIRGDLVIANFCSFFSFPRRRISKSPFSLVLIFSSLRAKLSDMALGQGTRTQQQPTSPPSLFHFGDILSPGQKLEAGG
jgi:hypothetical protein